MSRWGCVVLPLLLGACSSGPEQFCTLGLGIARVEIDVVALPAADEVCVGPSACVPVRDGAAELAEPLVSNDTTGIQLLVRDETGALLAEADVRLPRRYGNGFDCGGDAPAGTVTFLSADEVAVTEDVDGSGRTRSG